MSNYMLAAMAEAYQKMLLEESSRTWVDAPVQRMGQSLRCRVLVRIGEFLVALGSRLLERYELAGSAGSELCLTADGRQGA